MNKFMHHSLINCRITFDVAIMPDWPKLKINRQRLCRASHLKLSPVGGDTNRGSLPWAVSTPPTIGPAIRQF